MYELAVNSLKKEKYNPNWRLFEIVNIFFHKPFWLSFCCLHLSFYKAALGSSVGLEENNLSHQNTTERSVPASLLRFNHCLHNVFCVTMTYDLFSPWPLLPLTSALRDLSSPWNRWSTLGMSSVLPQVGHSATSGSRSWGRRWMKVFGTHCCVVTWPTVLLMALAWRHPQLGILRLMSGRPGYFSEILVLLHSIHKTPFFIWLYTPFIPETKRSQQYGALLWPLSFSFGIFPRQ